VTVLVDDARWEWRGLQWAHLVSDQSYDELHDFARSLGKRRLGFQGDHYDIDSVDRARALDFGARHVDSRELVRRLREAGLRNRHGKPTWERLGSWPSGTAPSDLPEPLLRRAHSLEIDTTTADTALFADPVQRVLLCDLPARMSIPAEASEVATGRRSDGSWSIELFHPT